MWFSDSVLSEIVFTWQSSLYIYINWANVQCTWSVSQSVMSASLWPHGLHSTRLLCLWNSPGKNTRVGCHFLLQGIHLKLTQNYKSTICQWNLKKMKNIYLVSHLGSAALTAVWHLRKGTLWAASYSGANRTSNDSNEDQRK